MSVYALDNNISNLSSHNLVASTDTVKIDTTTKRLLGLGLKFCPTPSNVTAHDYTSSLDNLTRQIRLGFQFPNNP